MNTASPTPAEKVSKGSKKQNKCRFLDQLFDILESNKYPDIITWSEDGTKFIIKDVDTLCSEVLPALFTHKNFASFVRQLHMYYFKKFKVSGYHYCYANPNFRKNRPDLLENISRKKISKDHEATTTISNETSQTNRIAELEYENNELKLREKRLKLELADCHEIIKTLWEENRALNQRLDQNANLPPVCNPMKDPLNQPQNYTTQEYMLGFNQDDPFLDRNSFYFGDE